MKKVDEVAEDEGLKESIGKYAIHISSITEQVYQKEMEIPIEDMKRYLDGLTVPTISYEQFKALTDYLNKIKKQPILSPLLI